jgi:glycogen debranching enzyme
VSDATSLGAELTSKGAAFAVRSRNATRVDLCLFDAGKERRLAMNKVGTDIFTLSVDGSKEGQQYGFRADGPWDEIAGHRFDVSKLLLDPYAREITAHCDWHEELAVRGTDTALFMPKCVVRKTFANVKPLSPRRPQFIYEVPVKAFTKLHPDVPLEQRGTVAALAHSSVVAHFKRIGCDAVELMPITAWSDERHLARAGLRNAWGYNPVAMMAPEPSIAPGGISEVRDTIRALHDAGLRVFLDVVFNHTAESDFDGATISLRGLDNATYFRMNKGVLVNDTGCGNTLALDQPAAIDLVIATLRHWVLQCGIDGFRYDLAPVMGREADGFNVHAPLLEAINNDAVLGHLIHIAEPWDVGPGGYQLGNFPANWLEWNDHFRDDVRRFWRGDAAARPRLATRLAGSSDVFDRDGRKPSASVNFVAAHDGFAVADVVTFAHKQNLANGENNRDGSDGEVCWVDPYPTASVHALLASLFLARGTILLTAGDEFGRSQNGNNNAYAQDNELTWRDWQKADQSLIEFVAALGALRCMHSAYFADAFLTGETLPRSTIRDIVWLAPDGEELTQQEWQDERAIVLGMALGSAGQAGRLVLVFGRGGSLKEFVLPKPQPSMKWEASLSGDKFASFIETPAI